MSAVPCHAADEVRLPSCHSAACRFAFVALPIHVLGPLGRSERRPSPQHLPQIRPRIALLDARHVLRRAGCNKPPAAFVAWISFSTALPSVPSFAAALPRATGKSASLSWRASLRFAGRQWHMRCGGSI